MMVRFFRRLSVLGLALSLTAVPALAQAQAKPLDDKDNPQLIGKRDLNKGQMQFYSLEREVGLGRQLAAEIDRSSKLVTDPLVAEYVNRIAQNIVLNSDSKVPFTIKVIDANEINAFALPGGFLYVNRGLIEAAENEAELAGVIAHEVAHVAARHGMEQASKGQFINFASIPLIFLGGLGGYVIQQAAGLAVPLGFLKFSRGAEKEADRLGAQYMWASGYDPNALVTFFEKLQSKEKKKPGTLAKIFSSHPMTQDRIKEVQQLLVRFPERGEYQLSSSEFNSVKSRVATLSAAARSTAGDDRGRPTLKRRPQTQSDDTLGDSGGASDRPTLKRRPDSGSSTSTGSTGDSSSDSERPVLKRRDSSANDPAKPSSDSTEPTERQTLEKTEKSEKSADEKANPSSSSSSSDTERPKLKRKPDSN
jgi:predicted Zn-dependent protease